MPVTIRQTPALLVSDSYSHVDAYRDRSGIRDVVDALSAYHLAEAHAVSVPAGYRFMTRWREMGRAAAPPPARRTAARPPAEANPRQQACPLDF